MLNRRRMMMCVQSPAKGDLSYSWDYTMGVPDTALWDYPLYDEASISPAGDDGLHFYASLKTNSYAGLRFKNNDALFGQKAVYEVEVKVISTGYSGFRIVLSSGSNGVSDKHGLQVTLNGNYLNVLTGSTVVNTITRTALLTYEEWHKVRLELDTITGINKVYLDDALVSEVSNASLSTTYVSSIWCLMHRGECYVRAVRYRKED